MTKWISAISIAACMALLAAPATAVKSPAAPAPQTATEQKKARKRAWPTETMSGAIMMVNLAEKRLVVKDAQGVPFDMEVTSSTRILSGHSRLTLQDLSGRTNQTVTVKFIPKTSGDVAETIRVTSA